MRKFSFAILLCSMLCGAQPSKAQMRVGALLGINRSSLSLETANPLPYASRTNFAIGAVAEIAVRRNMTLRVEPMLLRKGAQAVRAGDYELIDRFTYFEIPLLAKYEFGANEMRPYALAGPTLGFLLNAKRTMAWSDGDHEEQDLKSVLTGSDWGFTFGAGVSRPWRGYTLFAELRSGFGFSDIAKTEKSQLKNKGLQFLLGATLPLHKKNSNKRATAKHAALQALTCD